MGIIAEGCPTVRRTADGGSTWEGAVVPSTLLDGVTDGNGRLFSAGETTIAERTGRRRGPCIRRSTPVTGSGSRMGGGSTQTRGRRGRHGVVPTRIVPFASASILSVSSPSTTTIWNRRRGRRHGRGLSVKGRPCTRRFFFSHSSFRVVLFVRLTTRVRTTPIPPTAPQRRTKRQERHHDGEDLEEKTNGERYFFQRMKRIHGGILTFDLHLPGCLLFRPQCPMHRH